MMPATPRVHKGTRRPGRIAPPTGPTLGATNALTQNASRWTPSGEFCKVPVDLWTFLTAEELDDAIYRPKPTGLKHKGITGGRRSTAEEVWCKIQQVYEQTGHDLKLDPTPWETCPPPGDKIAMWAGDRARRAHLCSHQPALRWLYAYWGIGKHALPPFLGDFWRSSEFRDRAVAQGVVKPRARFFTPDDVMTLIASKPFTDALKTTKLRNSQEHRAVAAFKDNTFRFMVFASAYLVPRPSEWRHATVETFDIKGKRIVDWRQLKKNLKPRSTGINEEHVFSSPSPAFPTVAWYLEHVRPGNDKPGPMILQPDGSPYGVPEKIVREGINHVLGPNSPGPHGLRRFGITEAYRAGWTQDALCKIAGDVWQNIKVSYIDWDRLDNIDRPEPRDNKPRPARPMLTSNGRRQLWKTTQRQILANAETAANPTEVPA